MVVLSQANGFEILTSSIEKGFHCSWFIQFVVGHLSLKMYLIAKKQKSNQYD